MINYYSVLEVGNFASYDDIRTAYRRLSKQWHPDVNGGSEYHAEKFKEIQAAYDCLGKPDKREMYDDKLKSFLNGYERDDTFQRTTYYSYTTYTEPVYQREKSPGWLSGRMLFRFAYLTFFVFRVYTCNETDSSNDFYRVNSGAPVIVTYERKKSAQEILDSFAKASRNPDTPVSHAQVLDDYNGQSVK